MKAIQIVHHKSKRIYGIMKYKKDEICYIIENNIKIVPVKILKYSSEFYTVKLLSKAGAIRLKEHRIFATEEEARKILGIDRVNRKLNVSASDIVSITPLAGQNYPNWGGCYYYKSGSRVHVHLGIQGLQANQVATVFVLPEAVHPKTRIFSVGPSGSFPGVSRTEIALDGGVNVTSNDSYAAADIEYDTY